MDPTNLPPAPWTCATQDYGCGWVVHALVAGGGQVVFSCSEKSYGAKFPDVDCLRFIALARAALDVMLRREWAVRRASDGWMVVDAKGHWLCHPRRGSWFVAADPFTALVDADRWMKENVEKEIV